MKRSLVALALLSAACAAKADIVYDTLTTRNGINIASGSGTNRAGDNFLFGNTGGATSLNISQIEISALATAAGTYTVPVTLNLYRTVGIPNSLTAGASPAFTDLLGTRTLTFTVVPTAQSLYVLPFTSLNFTVPTTPGDANTGFGIEFVFGANTASASGVFVPVYTNTAPTIGVSSNGFYYDGNVNGTIQNSEFTNFAGYANGNLSFRINAQPVPEPSALAALGLGAFALLRRRKRA